MRFEEHDMLLRRTDELGGTHDLWEARYQAPDGRSLVIRQVPLSDKSRYQTIKSDVFELHKT